MVCETKSYEKGYGWNDWNRYVIELEYELIPEAIEPSLKEAFAMIIVINQIILMAP